MDNIYWYNHQTQLIMYWNLLARCLHKFNGTSQWTCEDILQASITQN